VGVGTILLERGLINREQLDRATEEQNRTGERLDHVMVRLGLVSSSAVLEVIGHQFALPIVDLDSIDVDPEVLKLLPPKLIFQAAMRSHRALRRNAADRNLRSLRADRLRRVASADRYGHRARPRRRA